MNNIRMKGNVILFVFLFCSMETAVFSQEKTADLRTFSDNTLFNNAAQFYKLKKYDKALELFSEYLEIYLNGLHKQEAYKNIAAIYFEQFKYLKSIEFYKLLYEEYSSSEQGIEGYFMSGICYQKIGSFEKAKEIFRSIMDKHPGSNFAYQSKIKLDLIEILESS